MFECWYLGEKKAHAYCWVCFTLLTPREIIVWAGRFLLFNTPPNWKARPLSIENWCTLHAWPLPHQNKARWFLFNPRRRCGLFTRIAFFCNATHLRQQNWCFLANWFKDTELKLPWETMTYLEILKPVAVEDHWGQWQAKNVDVQPPPGLWSFNVDSPGVGTDPLERVSLPYLTLRG